MGTDTGGSIRIPSALCGIVGLKPTYGLVSVAGTVPLSKTMDHAGPMARSVADACIILEAIAGPYPRGMRRPNYEGLVANVPNAFALAGPSNITSNE